MAQHRPGTPGARRRAQVALGPERAEQVRTAAETMAVGALFLLFALPVVTAGASWCAASEIVADWHRRREPPLLRTFARVVRRDLAAGLVLECVLLAVVALVRFETAVVLDARMPGYRAEAGALVLLGTAAVGFALLAVGCRAASRVSWRAAVRMAAGQVRAVLSTLPLAVTALAFTGVLIAVVPAFAAFMAGPLAFAVSAVVARNGRLRPAGGDA
ncbi:DUF624 domain-containing protein [Kitasatospora paranensis]|uniref:DUF624 domain-containing protein n=1 Tax=Kitasatospora paranensis TaxID=258053 RepID=A0ABW2FN29_9ACTN